MTVHDPRLAALLDAVGPLPAWLADLISPDARPEDFDAGVILSTSGKHRVYAADRLLPAAWEATVRRRWPKSARLLDAAPAGARRMLDTSPDGRFAEVYLDDLQEVRPDLGLLCLVWTRADGLARIRPATELPRTFSALSPLSGEGKLALRRGGGPAHALWVTEARWTGRAAEVDALARSVFALLPLYDRLRARVPGLYIDALDVHADGTVNLTVGVLPERPA